LLSRKHASATETPVTLVAWDDRQQMSGDFALKSGDSPRCRITLRSGQLNKPRKRNKRPCFRRDWLTIS
jgi:hypothetical protein